MKRFYKSVAITGTGPFGIALDGRDLKTPARKSFLVPSSALAEAVAAEWDGQGDTLDIAAMHLTRLANVAIDRAPHQRDGMVAEVARYCETDLLCFLPEGPEDLRAALDAASRPWRVWAGQALGILLIEAPGGTLHMPQPPASLEAARTKAAALDDFRLTALVYATALYGSALLAFAVIEGELGSAEAYETSIIEETWQAGRWGWDEDAVARHDARRAEARALGRLVEALRA